MLRTGFSSCIVGKPRTLLAIVVLGCSIQVGLGQSAIWKGGVGDWRVAGNWKVDGETSKVAPGFTLGNWQVKIKEENSTVFLDSTSTSIGPTVELVEIGNDDILQISGSDRLNIATNTAGQIINSGQIIIAENGGLFVQGSRNPFRGIASLTGGGSVNLDGEPVDIRSGARIGGQGQVPRVLVNEDNIITGMGRIGMGSMVLVNGGVISANQKEKKLIVNPGGGTPEVPGTVTNDFGATLSATNGGILVLSQGDFINRVDPFGQKPDGRIIADAESFVDLAVAEIIEGELISLGTGKFRVTRPSTLNGVELNGHLDVLDGTRLDLKNTITNKGTIQLHPEKQVTNIRVDGLVHLTGKGKLLLSPVRGSGVTTGANPGSLVNEAGHTIEGAGRMDSGSVGYRNETGSTIRANVRDQSLRIKERSDVLVNRGTVEATDGSTLHFHGPWGFEGPKGLIQATDESTVILDSVGVSGQTLKTPDNQADHRMDTERGLIEVRGATTFFVDPPGVTNEGLVEVTNGGTLTLQSVAETNGRQPPDFINEGTVHLNASDGAEGRTTSLNVREGDVQLSGGGRLVLSDSPNNVVSSTEIANTLINSDGTIEGAGNIGANRLNIQNLGNGTILATSRNNPLIIDPAATNIASLNTGIMQARDGATMILRTATFENSGSMDAITKGTFRIEDAVFSNDATVLALGPQSNVAFQATQIMNTGSIEADEGGVVRFQKSVMVNGGRSTDGTLHAGDTSLVELSGNTVVGGGLISTEGSGVVRVMDKATLVSDIANHGHLEVVDGATLQLVGDGVLEDGRFISENVVNEGTITLGGDSLGSQIIVLGGVTLGGSGTIQLSDNTFNEISGALLLNLSNTIRGAGRVDLIPTGESKVIADGVNPLTIIVQPFFEGLRPTSLDGSVDAQGDGGVVIDAVTEIRGRARIEVASNSQATFRQVYRNFGPIRIDGSAVVAERIVNGSTSTIVINGTFKGVLENFGTVSGSGLINGKLVSDGKFSPGESPGLFTINGDFVQLEDGALEIELTGGTTESQYDVLQIHGTATLGGTVQVSLLSPGDGIFWPDPTVPFEFLKATNGIVGEFDQVVFGTPGIDGNLDVKYGPDGVTVNVLDAFLLGDFDGDNRWTTDDIDLLSAAVATAANDPTFDLTNDGLVNVGDLHEFLTYIPSLPGDADLDGSVLFSDFIALSNRFGQTGVWSQGDFDGSGIVQFPDFIILSSNFGLSIGQTTAIPEPEAAALVFVSALALPLWRLYGRRRRRDAREPTYLRNGSEFDG